MISRVIIRVTPFRARITLLITYLLSPLPLQVNRSGFRIPGSAAGFRNFSEVRRFRRFGSWGYVPSSGSHAVGFTGVSFPASGPSVHVLWAFCRFKVLSFTTCGLELRTLGDMLRGLEYPQQALERLHMVCGWDPPRFTLAARG